MIPAVSQQPKLLVLNLSLTTRHRLVTLHATLLLCASGVHHAQLESCASSLANSDRPTRSASSGPASSTSFTCSNTETAEVSITGN